MPTKLSKEQVIAFTQQAMAPLECVAEFRDYDIQFGFAVYFPDARKRRVFEGFSANTARNPDELNKVLMQARSELLKGGEKLNDWGGVPPLTDC